MVYYKFDFLLYIILKSYNLLITRNIFKELQPVDIISQSFPRFQQPSVFYESQSVDSPVPIPGAELLDKVSVRILIISE